MPLTITDFIEQVDDVSTEDIPLEERERINDALADLTGGPGGTGAPVNNNAILVSKSLDGREGFNSIQSAVNSASTGNTIFVEPGEYSESVTISVNGLTLEGPNAGIAGDSDERGDEASFEVGGDISADNVTIDGFELTGSSFSSVTGENTVIRNTAADVDDSAVVRLEDGSDGTVITQNAFTGDGGNFAINARQSFSQLIDDVEITDNSFEDITGSGKTAIQAAGFTNAAISGNIFDGVSEDAVRLAGDVTGTEVTDNEFSNYTQSSGFSAGAIVANDASGDNVDVSGNEFNDAGGDGVYVAAFNRNDPAALDLGTIAGNNSFEFAAVQADIDGDGTDDALRPSEFVTEGVNQFDFNDDGSFTTDVEAGSPGSGSGSGYAHITSGGTQTTDYATTAVSLSNPPTLGDLTGSSPTTLTYEYYAGPDNTDSAPDEVYLLLEESDGTRHAVFRSSNDNAPSGESLKTRNVHKEINGNPENNQGFNWMELTASGTDNLGNGGPTSDLSSVYGDDTKLLVIAAGRGTIGGSGSVADVYYRNPQLGGSSIGSFPADSSTTSS